MRSLPRVGVASRPQAPQEAAPSIVLESAFLKAEEEAPEPVPSKTAIPEELPHAKSREGVEEAEAVESPEHVKIDVEGEDHVAPEEEGRRSSERSKGGKRPSWASRRMPKKRTFEAPTSAVPCNCTLTRAEIRTSSKR